MRSVVDRNVVMRRIPVLASSCLPIPFAVFFVVVAVSCTVVKAGRGIQQYAEMGKHQASSPPPASGLLYVA
jgi:hypothetical protein